MLEFYRQFFNFLRSQHNYVDPFKKTKKATVNPRPVSQGIGLYSQSDNS